MSHSLVVNRLHCVFSTKNRVPCIPQSDEARLWAFIGGIARANAMKALAIGGVENHLHILLLLPQTITVSKAMQLIKAGSSKWCNQNLKQRRFEWQTGYSAFSIGQSQVQTTITYINNQREHHKKRTFEDELRGFAKKNGLSEKDFQSSLQD
jgi:putative transposase